MAYGIAGVDFTLQPTDGRWMLDEPIGMSGDGHPIYPNVTMFQLVWGLMDIPAFNEIYNYYQLVGLTGTLVSTLPNIEGASYGFKNYSGTVMQRPVVGEYFTQHVKDVRVMITNIRP